MARIYGSNRVIGTIGGVRHYKLPGSDEIYAAESGGADKNLIENNPAFARTRENNMEWKGVTKMAKSVKRALGESSITIVNRYLIGDLNKAMLKVLRRDDVGKRGSHSIFLSAHKDLLDYVKYYFYKPFTDIMKCRYEVETGPDRTSVTVKLSNLYPSEQIKPPPEATHFQFFLSIGTVCDYVYKPEDKNYVPVYDSHRMHFYRKEIESSWMPVNARALGDVTYSVKLPDAFQLADDMTVLRIFGIAFGKMTSEVEPLKRNPGSVEFLRAV